MHFEPIEDATFLFPPATYADATEYIRFWLTIPVSDGTLANITVGYAELMRKEAIAAGNGWGVIYDRENDAELHHKRPEREAAADRARASAYEEFIGGWYANNPKEIRAPHARTIARAGQIFFFSAALSREQQDEVLRSTMSLADSAQTVRDIYSDYRLHYIRNHFQLPAVTSSELLLDIRLELQKLRG